MTMELKTPLYDCHVALEGRMVPFAGYVLPVQYPTGVICEHMAVRQACGLFDVSHMGEVLYRGPDALANLQKLLTNDFSTMRDGKVRYSVMCNPQGGVVDDLIVYRFSQDAYWVVVNAANRHKDVNWMRENLFGDCELTDMSDSVAQLALQGPKAGAIFAKVCDQEPPTGYYTFIPEMTVAGVKCLVSRTGYTGEDGFELYCANADAPALWNALLEAGKDDGLIPCGLGARDTLRLEAAMPLYGHEMNDEITPKMAGLPCKLTGKDFIGRDALVALGAPKLKRIGMKVVGRGIVREHCDLYSAPDGEKIGWTSSGTFAPYLGCCVAMGYVPVEDAEIGKHVYADVRGRKVEMEIVPTPFYKR